MNDIEKNKYTKAISFLMTQLSDKRYGLPVYTKGKDCPEKTEEVIKYIYNKHNLNYHQLKDDSESVNYELYLSDYISEIIDSKPSSSIEDEIIFLNNTKNIDPKIPKSTVNISSNDKTLLNYLGITLSGIDSWFLNPEYSNYLKIKTDEYLFNTKKVQVNSREKILFSILQIQVDSVNKKINSYSVLNVFVLDYNKHMHMMSSPSRIFLYIIDKYSSIIEFKGEKKHFFYYIEERDSKDSLILKLSDEGSERRGHMAINPIIEQGKLVGNWSSLVYVLKTNNYLNDYKRFSI